MALAKRRTKDWKRIEIKVTLVVDEAPVAVIVHIYSSVHKYPYLRAETW
jgi:hypothetical protein